MGVALIITTLLALSLFAMLFSKIVQRKKGKKNGVLHGSSDMGGEEICANSFDMGLVNDVCKAEVPNDFTVDDSTYSDLDTNITSANHSLTSELEIYHFEPENDETLKNIDFSNTSIDMFGKKYNNGPTDETVAL